MEIKDCFECQYFLTGVPFGGFGKPYFFRLTRCLKADLKIVAENVDEGQKVNPPAWCPYRKENMSETLG